MIAQSSYCGIKAVPRYTRSTLLYSWTRTLKSQVRLDDKLDPSPDPLHQRPPFLYRKGQPKVRDRDRVAVDRVVVGRRVVALHPMGDDLVAVKVKVDPGGGGAALGAAEEPGRGQRGRGVYMYCMSMRLFPCERAAQTSWCPTTALRRVVQVWTYPM